MSEKTQEEKILEAANALVKLVADSIGEPPYDAESLRVVSARLDSLSYSFFRERDEEDSLTAKVAAQEPAEKQEAGFEQQVGEPEEKPIEQEVPQSTKPAKGKAKPKPVPESAPESGTVPESIVEVAEAIQEPTVSPTPAEPTGEAVRQLPGTQHTAGQEFAAKFPEVSKPMDFTGTHEEAATASLVNFPEAAKALKDAATKLAKTVNDLGTEGGALTGLHGAQIVRAVMRRHDLAATQLLAVPPSMWPDLYGDLSAAITPAAGLTDAKFEEFCGQASAALTAEPRFRDAYDAIATRLVVGKALDGAKPVQEEGF